MPSHKNNRTGAPRVRGERRYVVDGRLLILPEDPVAPELDQDQEQIIDEVVEPVQTPSQTPPQQPESNQDVEESVERDPEETMPCWVEPPEGTHELPCWVDTPLPEAKGIEPIIEVKDLNPLPKNPRSPKK